MEEASGTSNLLPADVLELELFPAPLLLGPSPSHKLLSSYSLPATKCGIKSQTYEEHNGRYMVEGQMDGWMDGRWTD